MHIVYALQVLAATSPVLQPHLLRSPRLVMMSSMQWGLQYLRELVQMHLCGDEVCPITDLDDLGLGGFWESRI